MKISTEATDSIEMTTRTFKDVVLFGRKVFHDAIVDGKKVRRIVGYSSGLPVIDFNTIRSSQGCDMIFQPVPYETHETHYSGRYLYLGELVSHYGHLILDSCSRLWPLLDGTFKHNEFDGVIFVRDEDEPREGKVWNIMLHIMESLGLSIDDCFFIEMPTAFEEVIVPRQSSVINWYCHDKHCLWADQVVNAIKRYNHPSSGKLIYVSRRQIPKRMLPEELELEQALAAFGIEIVFPEKLTFTEQVSIFSNADLLIGCEGTALLNSLFSSAETTVISIGNPDARRNRTQSNVCRAKGQMFHVIDAVDDRRMLDIQKVVAYIESKCNSLLSG